MKNGWRDIVMVVRDVGFPIFVAAYLLVQLAPALDRLSAQVDRISVLLESNHEVQRQLLEELRRH